MTRAQPAASPVSLRARQAQVARDAALDAVVDLLERGELADIGDLSMPEVARAAGVSLRTLYRYFPTREALLAEAGGRIQARLGLPIGVGGPDDIPASFWSASGRLAERPRLARALLRTAAGRSAHAPNRSARVQAIHDAIAPLTSTLPPARARQVAGVIAHLCSSAAWVTISAESSLSADDARRGVRWALEILLDALGAEAAGPDRSTTGPDPVRKEKR